MNPIHEWNPQALMQLPLFAPLHLALSRCDPAVFPRITDWNNMLGGDCAKICVHSGRALRFVAQEQGKLGFESQYEPRCYLSGEVQTRENNWHDLFNALVWLTFPRAKAAINARHYGALKSVHDGLSQRGRARDMVTLLDESGVIVACSKQELSELLLGFKWKELFWQRREQLMAGMGFFIIGHGLYEKALKPYVGMTGQGLLVSVPDEFFAWGQDVKLNYLDERVAEYIDAPGHCQTTRELHPVPLLGVPGWDDANCEPAYYDNVSYFRTSRRAP